MTALRHDVLKEALGDAVSTETGLLDVMRTTMRIAQEHRTPVVTRGAGAGLAGGAPANLVKTGWIFNVKSSRFSIHTEY